MIRYLFGLFALAVTMFGAGQSAHKYDVVSMTPEQLEKKTAGQKRYDFDIAPDNGLIDSTGKAIHADELLKYLKAHALASGAAYYLWITPTSAPLKTIDQTVKVLGDYGVTTVVVRYRPEAVNNNRNNSSPETDADKSSPKKTLIIQGKPNPGAIDATAKFPLMEDRPVELRPDPLPRPVRYEFASDKVVLAAAQRAIDYLLSPSLPQGNLFGKTAFIQSGAWILLQDAKVALKGARVTHSTVRLKRGTITLEGGFVSDATELTAVVTALRGLIQADGGGKVRALHTAEMAKWWVYIGFDIEEPVFVLETTGGRYRFILSFTKNDLLTVDEPNALPDPRS